jgi:spoIIIJ-associated protein
MPSFLEFEGKNVEKALQKASEELNTPIEKLKHDVVSYGSSGIFGLVGAKKAKIRVFVKDESTKAKKARPIPKETEVLDIKVEEKEDQAAAVHVLGDANQALGDANQVDSGPEIDESRVEKGLEVIRKLVGYITPDAQISAQTEQGRLRFNIQGGDTAILIGKRGQTLEALQYLVEKMINVQNEGRIKILIDVEGYLETRKQNLEMLAARLAEKAKKAGKPMTIKQMNAHDRRIVHLFLKDDSEVRTQSVGEGYYRKLMIFPKKKARTRNGENQSS